MNKNMNTKIGTGVVAAIIAIVIFYGGMRYGQAHAQSTFAAAFNSRAGMMNGIGNTTFGGRVGVGGARGGMMGGVVAGQILSKDATSITVKLQNGGSKIVFTSDATQVSKQVTGSLADVVVGANVNVIGTPNSDGSVTAQAVQIRPAGMFGSTTPIR